MTQQTKKTGESSRGIHRLLTLMLCPRKFGYRYVLCLNPKIVSRPLTVGTGVHDCLEAHYREIMDTGKANPRAYLNELDRIKREHAWCYEDVQYIIEGYFRHYAFERIHVLAVEREYELTIEGQTITRRIDLVYEHQGTARPADHKTASDVQNRSQATQLDASLWTQELVFKARCQEIHGLPYGGFVLNLIPKRGGRGTFSRMPVEFPQKILDDAPASLARWMRVEEKLLASGRSVWQYTQNYNACYGRYGPCDYHLLCVHGSAELGQYEFK